MRELCRLFAAAVILATGLTLAGTPVAANTVTVTIGSGLDPRTFTIAPGTVVEWRNADGDRHRVRTSDAPEEFDSGNLEPGDSWSTTLTAKGTYRYVDDRDRSDTAYHGTITVAASGSGSGPGGSPGSGGAPSPAPPTSASVSVLDRSF